MEAVSPSHLAPSAHATQQFRALPPGAPTPPDVLRPVRPGAIEAAHCSVSSSSARPHKSEPHGVQRRRSEQAGPWAAKPGGQGRTWTAHLPWPVPHVFLHPHIQYNTQHLSIKCITHDSPPQLGRIPPSSTGGSCSIFNPFTSFYLYCMLLSEVVLGRPEPFSVRKQAIQGVPQSSTVHASTKAGDVQDDDPFQGRWDINLMADPSGVASNTHQAGFLQSTTFRKLLSVHRAANDHTTLAQQTLSLQQTCLSVARCFLASLTYLGHLWPVSCFLLLSSEGGIHPRSLKIPGHGWHKSSGCETSEWLSQHAPQTPSNDLTIT